jgi:hypothetical protein
MSKKNNISAQPGISNRETAAQEAAERQRHPPHPASDNSSFDVPEADAASKDASEIAQSSSKAGSRSTAQKEAESKYANRPHPGSEKVEGAFGREADD